MSLSHCCSRLISSQQFLNSGWQRNLIAEGIEPNPGPWRGAGGVREQLEQTYQENMADASTIKKQLDIIENTLPQGNLGYDVKGLNKSDSFWTGRGVELEIIKLARQKAGFFFLFYFSLSSWLLKLLFLNRNTRFNTFK